MRIVAMSFAALAITVAPPFKQIEKELQTGPRHPTKAQVRAARHALKGFSGVKTPSIP